MVNQGHLDQWIDRAKTPNRQNAQQPSAPHAQQLPVINVIHGPVNKEAEQKLRADLDRATASRHVYTVETAPKHFKSDSPAPWSITFTEQDLLRVQTPHTDALVVTTQINSHIVKRILVDQGSSAEVMFYSLFKRLGLKEDDLTPTDVPLVGFSGSPVYPLGKISLPVCTGSVTLNLEFVVVNVPSPYNAILGRSWLHGMKAIASTYHQLVRFIGASGRQEDLHGDQVASKKCYISSIHNSSREKPVHWIEVPDAPVLEDVGAPAEEKAIEDLVTVPITDDGSRFFLIGSSLNATDREQMIQFLKLNIDAFAWTPYEMPGVDPSFICHKLNVAKEKKPVVQRPRRSAPAHTEAVIEEVDRLLEADAIRDVQYPTWLANTVVVKKKNGKWRVCVDYTNLNDACPKDCIPLPRIDQLVDATAAHARLSFMDAYLGYHQIAMDADDMEKTAFITPRGIYCYKVMPFGLKNAGATYQRMVSLMFKRQLGDTMEAYIDDMVVKSKLEADHLTHLADVFATLRKHRLKLNAEKYAFGVGSGKFLGYLVTRRGIEADPNQITAIQQLRAPTKSEKSRDSTAW